MTKYEIGASEDMLVNLVLNTILYLYHFHFTCLQKPTDSWQPDVKLQLMNKLFGADLVN